MSNLRMNSVLGVALASALGILGLGVAAETLVHPNYPEKAAYLPEVVVETSAGAAAAPAGPPDFGVLFADAAQLAELVARGERVSAQCTACHTFEAGGANGIGPNLHDAFGRQAASSAGYAYSEAMIAHTGPWDYLRLDEFLRSPSRAVSGTKMAFAGLRNDEDRVAMIAYLRSISPNNLPLPAPLPQTQTAEAAPADAGAQEGVAAPPT